MQPRRWLAASLSMFLSASLLLGAPTAGLADSWQAKVDDGVLREAERGETEFIVYMRAKADVHKAHALAKKSDKGAFVYKALTDVARTSQAALLAQLDLLGVPYRSFWIANAVLVKGDAAVLEVVALRPDIEAIFSAGVGRLDPPVDPPAGTQSTQSTTAVGPSITHVRANEAWALGYRGQGAVVAGADTGVRWTHNAIKNQYRGWNGATGTARHDYNWHDAAGPNAACPADESQPCDDNDHGTHTVGTIVGDDGGANQIGVAPDAEWIACRNMNQGVGAVPTYMDCMQWFIAPTDLASNNPDPTKAPDVVNNSWGCVEACAPPLLKDMIDASRHAGIVYVVSAGNDNQFFLGLTMACNTVNFPLAVYKSAFTVGATGATSDNIAWFSSLGPVASNPSEGVNYRKPDIVAPGDGIRSATSASDNSYASFSGTSMAGPHVAGVVALIISANPALRGDVDTIEDIIEQTAVPRTSNLGCGDDSSAQVPNNVYGWGRIDALAAVQLAAMTDPSPTDPHSHEGELLDPAHNVPAPCELVNTLGYLPRSARDIAHVANVCGLVGTDLEFQSRTDANGDVHDYVFLGTMGAGTRIYDVTDPRLPRFVGGYVDPGWQNDVQVFGDTLIMAFDPVGVAVHASDCLRTKDPANGQIRGGVDFVRLEFDPQLAALKAPLTFQTSRLGCYLTAEGGGAHTITINPSGEWLALNTSTTGIEVVDLRDAFSFVRKIPAAIVASAHDVFFSEDGNTLYSAGVGSTRIVDVSDIFNRAPVLLANVPNSPSAEQGADGHVVAISHQSDTTADGRLMIVTDEKGGGLSQTACNTSAGGAIGGAHFWALEELPESDKSSGATVAAPRKIGTWIYPNPKLAVDALDGVLADLGRTERACTIHVYRGGGNAGQSPAPVGQGKDGNDGVSRLPINEIVSAHYGAGVWHIDVFSEPGELDDSRTTWGRTLGWNVMPGADTWSAKEYKGYIYAGDMARGLDIYTFSDCTGVQCVDLLTPPEPSTPDDPDGCSADQAVYFLGIVYDEALREDFRADVRNFEHYLATLGDTYCIPDSQATILAMDEGYTDTILGKSYSAGSEANLKAELRRMGAELSQKEDALFFFFLSSHGNVWSGSLPSSACPPDRLAGSFAALGEGGGEDGLLDDCELGDELNENFSEHVRMFVAVDCSFCGGFSDSLTAASGTIPDGGVPTSSGVPGPNRIVITGCAITTECFGSSPASNGGVTYHHMRRVLDDEVSCDGWTAPGFPDVQGFDAPVNGPPHRALDGRCTVSEWFFGAVWSAYSSGDAIGIQQQFRIKYGFDSLDDDILIFGGQADPDPTPTPTPTPTPEPLADLQVTDMTATSQKPKEGERVMVSATISNSGDGQAGASQTEFRLSDGTLLGLVETPAIAAGVSVDVEVGWDTRGFKGEEVISATADAAEQVAETNENNNLGQLTLSIRGNKVQNSSFEQPNSAGDGPADWEGNSTGAGKAGWAEGGSDGDRAVTVTGTGKSVVLHGQPSWTSAPISVSAGELLSLTADVRSVGLSSAPSVGLAYLGPAGEVLSSATVLTAPLSSDGFVSLDKTLTVPQGVASLRIVLYAFSASDLKPKGTVTFDNIGLYGD